MLTRDERGSDILSWSIGFSRSIYRHWRVAIGGTILAMGVAAIVVHTLPNRYRSQATLPLSTNTRAAFTSGLFLAPVAKAHFPDEFDRTPNVAISRLKESMGAPREFERSSNLYRIDIVWDNDPTKAKDILTSIVNESLKWSRPVGSNRENQLEQIASLEANIPNLRKLYQQFSSEARENKELAEVDRIPSTLLAIENDISMKEAKLITLRRSLDGITREDVVEWPSEPERQGGRFGSAAAVGIALILLTMTLLYFLHQLEESRRPE